MPLAGYVLEKARSKVGLHSNARTKQVAAQAAGRYDVQTTSDA